jgi:predicted regulator of Ras-like GTPase activity (Roadblock/LC7/MglB family)
MPFKRLLEHLVDSVEGAQAALLLDSQGEVVVESGRQDHRHRLIGAYQGITLSRAEEAARRCDFGELHYLIHRYQGGSIVLQPLKDGYYLVLSLSPQALVAEGVRKTLKSRDQLNGEL